MPAAPGAPPGYPPNAGARKPGLMHALSAPPGATRVLWTGVLLMVVSFAAKQLLVDVFVHGAGGLLEKERLLADQQAELAEVEAPLLKLEDEIDALSDAPAEDDEAAKKALEEKVASLKTNRADLDKTLQPKRKKIRSKYRPQLREAERESSGATAFGIGLLQTTLTLKLVVDLVKLIGASLVVLAALRISVDPDASGGSKAYAAVLGGVAFISMVIGGLYAALLG